jgi:hypothetical protein
MNYKGKPLSPKDKEFLDKFESQMKASADFWQGFSEAISAHQIENLQRPRPLPVRKPQPKVINLIEKLKEAFYQQSISGRPGRGKPTPPKVMFITPDIAIVEIDETPDLTVEDCAPPDTMSEDNILPFGKKGGSWWLI